MNVQNILSIALLALFVLMVRIRSWKLKKRGIRTIVFGRTDKSDFLLIPCVLAIVYSALAKPTGLPMWIALVRPFWDSTVPGWAGIGICLISNIGFALTLADFGDSFRVGIDEDKPGELITGGMFAISRNPIYVCFLLFFTGMFVVHRNIVMVVAVLVFSLAIHRQVLREEKFLKQQYGEQYKEYCKKVRRYL